MWQTSWLHTLATDYFFSCKIDIYTIMASTNEELGLLCKGGFICPYAVLNVEISTALPS